MVKNLPDSVGDTGSIPGSRIYPLEEEMSTHSSIFAWKISWTEEPGEVAESNMSEQLSMHVCYSVGPCCLFFSI